MSEPNAERCHVCGEDVSRGWFARIRHGEEWILLCSQRCTMRYYDSERPEQEMRAQELAANEHPLRFLVNRTRVHALKVPSAVLSFWKRRLQWADGIFDTLEILSFGKSFDSNGVDDVARVFGLPPKLGHSPRRGSE